MRTAILKKQIKECYDLLNVDATEVVNGARTYIVIKNWKEISWALYNLNEYNFIGNSVKNILEMGANFCHSTATTSILGGEYQSFETYLNIVKAKCEAIFDLEGENVNNENNIYVRLPDDLSDLDKLNEIIKGLIISFNKCPILSDVFERIDFAGVDKGSNWIILKLITGTTIGLKALNWFADYVKKCNEIRLQELEIKNKELEYVIKLLNFEKDEEERKLQDAKNKIEQMKKNKCIEMFKKIKFETNKDIEITPEMEVKITHSMMTLMDLLDKGVEIYPSIDTSEEIKAIFPKTEEWKKIDVKTKLLDDKLSEEDNTIK